MPSVFTVVTQPNRIEPPVQQLRHTVSSVRALTNSQQTEQRSDWPRVTLPYRLYLDSRATIAALDTWFDSVKGRFTSFWMPTYVADLKLTADVGSSDTTITISAMGYTARYFPNEPRRHLAFISADGTITARRVTASVDNGDGTETLTIASSLGSAFPRSAGLLSFLLLLRLADDEITVTRSAAAFGECVLSCLELPAEVPAS